MQLGQNIESHHRTNMTTDNNITITMQDVDVVMACNPTFKQLLLIAAESRRRAELTQDIEKEATEKKDAKG